VHVQYKRVMNKFSVLVHLLRGRVHIKEDIHNEGICDATKTSSHLKLH
jgi:hypothetical protein